MHQINAPLSRWVIIYLNVSQHSHFHVSLNSVPQFGTAHDATSHFSVRSAVGFQVQLISNLGLAAFLRARGLCSIVRVLLVCHMDEQTGNPVRLHVIRIHHKQIPLFHVVLTLRNGVSIDLVFLFPTLDVCQLFLHILLKVELELGLLLLW